ncbi:MAG: hypothetical protein QOD60_1442 [Solirubrobacterales bacterium]|jgi:hypothetical protein|nr:hypothetical protein [Solirubrobacterales bacterium]
MDTSRLSQGQMIAAISGVILIISLFLKWASFGPLSATGWESQNALDIYLFILAAIAIVPAVSLMTGGNDDFPYLTTESKVLTAVIGLVLMVFALIFKGDGLSLEFGFWLAFLATIGIVVGQFQAMNQGARG